MHNRNNNIAIIGGGILGMTSALALLDTGHDVTVFDPDEGLQAASWGNAGHIAVEQVEPIASPATIASVPGRLLDRDSALSLPLRAAGAWLPFGLSMMRAARPASFAAGRAALTKLITGAMQAWVDLVERLGEPDLLIREGITSSGTQRKARERWTAGRRCRRQQPVFAPWSRMRSRS
jgi:D-amino-acid dehydrogenase